MIVLQNICLADPEITDEVAIYVHRSAGVQIDLKRGTMRFLEGATAGLATYANFFNLARWTNGARLDDLRVTLTGRGRFTVRLHQHLTHWQSAPVHEGEYDVTDGATLDISGILGHEAPGDFRGQGLLSLELVALEDDAEITGGAWTTTSAGLRDIDLLISITTFRREADVADTAARLTRFLDEGPDLGATVNLAVVDNGQSVELAPHPRLTVIPNANLGGAGGFARGLAEGRSRGASHVLFMDDDASFAMENLIRTIAFLRLVRADNAAVVGAMISAGNLNRIWEAGAHFDGQCRPAGRAADFRDPVSVAELILEGNGISDPNFYGGWWFFAFPVAAIEHDPFPFFVRGDDISFSLGNPLSLFTLNGVVSFQEDFAVKESALTLYLDLRNHLHHHLVHDFIARGRFGTMAIVGWFFLRSICRMHYETATAQMEAWSDIMQGPDFFARNADMSVRRPQITALMKNEAWKDLETPHIPDRIKSNGDIYDRVLQLTLNGHLLPGYRFYAFEQEVPAKQRASLSAIWGSWRSTYYNVDGTQAYTVTHDKWKAAKLTGRFLVQAVRWVFNFDSIRRAHRKGYDRLTSPEFWQEQFDKGLPDKGLPDKTS